VGATDSLPKSRRHSGKIQVPAGCTLRMTPPGSRACRRLLFPYCPSRPSSWRDLQTVYRVCKAFSDYMRLTFRRTYKVPFSTAGLPSNYRNIRVEWIRSAHTTTTTKFLHHRRPRENPSGCALSTSNVGTRQKQSHPKNALDTFRAIHIDCL
jgi:hypothetical protein